MRHLLLLPAFLTATAAFGGSPEVVAVKATQAGGGWRFDVTLSHEDTGWDHYADGWGVYTEDGSELGYRVLHHPHVEEQPFTRSLGHVVVPGGVDAVVIVPRDNVHGLGDGFRVELK